MTSPLCVITGANSGIGFDASVELVKRGYDVVLCCRTTSKADKAKADIEAKGGKGKVFVVQLDLADLDNVKKFRERYDAVAELKDRPIDALVLNAGVMAINKLERTPQGHEMQMGTNVIGHFAFAANMMDLCKKAQKSRIVVVSSSAQHLVKKIDFKDFDREKGYAKWTVYGETKLGNMMFTRKLNRLLAEKGLTEKIVCVSVHPGYSNTNLQTNTAFASLNQFFAQKSWKGALPTILAVTDVDGKPNGFAGPNGMFEARGNKAKWNCRENKAASDEKAQDQLWEKCEEFTQVNFASRL